MSDQKLQPESHPAIAATRAALEALAARLNVPPEALEVERLERRDWPDTCLGCPEPDEACGDAITPGYVAFLSRPPQEQLFEYRADRAGHVRACPATGGGLPPELFRHWLHFMEADEGGIEEYRPEGSGLPIAFARDGFQIWEDGRFLQEDIGPADGIVRTPGRWEPREAGRIAVSFNSPARPDYAFDIVSVDRMALRIRRSPQELPVPTDAAQPREFAQHPTSEACRLIDFEQAQIVTLRSNPPRFVLRVSGNKPYANMGVLLAARVYVTQPEYWGIEVVGCLHGIGLPVMTPYSVSIRLDGILGTSGIEVIGASRAQRFDVPPKDAQCRDWTAWLNRQPPGPSTLHVGGVCEFPTPGYTVELRRHEPQGINPRDLLLDKVVHEPGGPQPQVVTTVNVDYREEASPGQFDTVTILPDGPTVPVRDAW